jgi:Rrf2 family nitric oxide-sensitive transcriptional repressor
MFLAANPGRLSTVAEIAGRFNVSQAHLMKVVHRLGRAGYVETVRGRSGGLRLAGDGSAIWVGDVVRHMESDLAPVECLSAAGGRCRITPCCRLKGVLATAMAAFLAALDEHSIADLARANDALTRLLGGRAA